MDSNDKFWLGFFSVFSLAVVLIVFSSQCYYSKQADVALSMVKTGYSPTEAMCALQGNSGQNPECIILATKKQGDKQ